MRVKYKIFKVVNGHLISPFQNYDYGKESEVLGEKFSCRIDMGENLCSSGFYATDIDGLIYTNLAGKECYEVRVSGEEKIFDAYKQRYEHMTIVRRIPRKELRSLAKNHSLDWDYYHALFPVNPLRGNPKKVTDKEIELLKNWASVRASVRASVWDSAWASVGDSVWASVGASVWDSVGASVWASVGDSVWDSVWAYVSSLFTIRKWKYIDHEKGKNPFQSSIDLWNSGFVPSHDGKTWRLHSGKNAKIVYELCVSR